MKKLTSTISTIVLIIMIPALFIGYLYNSSLTNNNSADSDDAKTGHVNNNHETSFKPGIAYFLKG